MSQYSITNYSPNPIHPPFDVETCGTATQPLVCGKYPEESDLAIGDLAKSTLSSLKTDELPKDLESAGKMIAKRLKAKIEARNSRDSMVTTRQMFTLLSSSHLKIAPGKLKEISSVLARQINEMVEDLDPYRGKSLPLESMKKKYPFYSFEKREKEMRTLPFDCWFEASEEAREVEVFMTPPNEKPIGTGTYKEVFKAQSLKIPLLVERAELSSTQTGLHKTQKSLYERHSTCAPMVLVKVKTGKEFSVERGIKLQEKLQKLAPLATLTSLVKEPLPFMAPLISTCKMYRQEWYNSDLGDAYDLGRIPLDMSDQPATLDLTPLDFINIIIDVAKSLTEWHKAGLVHRDVKLDNILLKVSPDKTTIQGVLGDYDIAQKPGFGRVGDYAYWDALSEKGLATPFTDLYGLALSLACVIIPKFTLNNPSSILSETRQKTYFLKVLKKYLTTTNHLKYGTRDYVLKKGKKLLNDKIRNSTGSTKKTFQLGLDEIDIVEGVITLTAHIVATNKNLFQTFGSLLFQTAETNQFCIAHHDIKACFPDKNTYRLITANVVDWRKLPHALKIKKAKEFIQGHLKDDALDHEVKLKLSEALAKFENRESALDFFSEIEKLDNQARSRHPLYTALLNPIELETQEIIEVCIKQEIQMGLFVGVTLCERVQKLCVDLKGKANRRTLKKFFQNILNDKHETCEIKQEAEIALNIIFKIEKAMAFALEMRDFYKKKIAEVSQTAPTLVAFLEQLNTIKSKLIVTSSQEEKTERL